MKSTFPVWLIGLAFLAVADDLWCSRNSCCFPQEQRSDAATKDNPPASDELAQQRQALTRLQEYIGQWKGVGQPKRGSTKDSWGERSNWAWHFADKDVSLQLQSEDAKFLRSAHLRPGAKPNEYVLTGKTPAGAEVEYVGVLGPDGLVLSTSKQVEGAPSRISIRLVADGDRMVVLYERLAAADRYSRMAEVGLTRQGSGFGKGTSYVECVVTGGLGTIAVMHQGQTYYVCCTGCRDYFNDNAAEVLAEYRARKAAK